MPVLQNTGIDLKETTVIKRKQQQAKHSSNESGFTIIESLMAIVVVSILLAGIAPVIVLSTANRVQAKRIERASLAAKTFVDAVRTQTIKPDIIKSSIPNIDLDPVTVGQERDLSKTLINSTNMPVPSLSDKTKLFCVDQEGKVQNPDCSGGQNLFFIQAAKIKVKDSNLNDGYRLAIRVYRKEAFDTTGALEASNATNKLTQQSVTGGLGKTKTPLVEMTSDITNGQTRFSSLCNLLGRADKQSCSS